MLVALVPLIVLALAAPPAPPAPPASPDPHAAPAPPMGLPALPALRDFARTAALPGSEGWLVEELLALLPADAQVERDAFGSVIVRAAGADAPCTRLVAVGLDEPGYVVSQVRDDGYLRLRFLGRTAGSAFHLAHEGRPALVIPRAALPPLSAVAPGQSGATPAGRPGVVLVNSIHLKNPRPASFDEADLWLDVGADSAAGVAALGVGLLDPVVLREVTAFGDRVAGPGLGRRAAALALLGVLRDVPRAQWREGLAVAFVAQSLPGTGPLGRGGEGLLRRLAPRDAVLLAALEGGAQPVDRVEGAVSGLPAGATPAKPPPPDGVAWSTLQLRVSFALSPVESVAAGDLAAFGEALRAEVAR